MFRHHLHKATTVRTRFDWFLLAFIAGSVNSGGWLGAHRFVSHVTGFATLFGVSAATGHIDQAVGYLTIPLFFLMGVMVSAYFIDRPFHLGQRPRYALVMGLVCGCLTFASLGGYIQLLGDFGSEPRLRQDYVLLALLCAASGLQNAAITTASGATVRTTHLTGLTTDLGIGLVRAFSEPGVYRSEMRAVHLRVGTILSFAIGSAVGAYLFIKFQFLGFLLPASLAGYAVFEALGPVRRLRRVQKIRAANRYSC
jgi:uncharacterized membrane protein YoaK (UPF0700 family)